jgi:TonB family protein
MTTSLVAATLTGLLVGHLDEGEPERWTPPRLEHYVEAIYPLDAIQAGAEGDVVLEIELDAEGRVTEAKVISAPHPSLGQAAREAALRFQFSPAHLGAVTAPSTVHYTYRFQLAPNAPQAAPDAPRVPAAPPPPQPTFETRVTAPAPTSAASAQAIRDRDLQLRLMRTPEDILRAVPGLVIAQHQGGGKADQLFLRGFDADHGTDVALFIDGVPINMPSHGHGQGYADLHFLIPETIDRLEVTKGPYFAEYGDFDTAGAVGLHTRHFFKESEASVTYGMFQTYRALGIGSFDDRPNGGWMAAEVYGTNGPFENREGLQRYNVFAKENLQLSPSTTLALLATAYGSQWSASGQIPERAVSAGVIDRLGAIDPSEGGQTQRQMLVANLESRMGSGKELDLTAYVVRYKLRLFNDFTFQLRDPINSDEIEQNDDRTYTGVHVRYHQASHLGEADFVTTFGASGRYDSNQASLYHDRQRVRLPDCFGTPQFCDKVFTGESNLAAYAQEDARLLPWLRIVAGVRADLFEFNVEDQAPTSSVPPATGVAQRSIVNPKLAAVFTPTHWWDLYLDAGGGFHSNDARSATTSGGDGALARAWGGEVGSRVNLWNQLDLAAALWFIYLSSEQVFNADTGGTSASDPTRRYGVDLEARWALYQRWLWVDLDLSLAHAAFTVDHGNGSAVALAPTRVITGGVTAVHPSGLRGRLALRHLGDRPATRDASLSAEGYTVLDLTAAYRRGPFEVTVTIENLTNTEWREAQFATVSRLAALNEGPAGVNDIHFTPGNPINIQATLAVYF